MLTTFFRLTICFLLTMVAVSTLLDCYYQEMPHSLSKMFWIPKKYISKINLLEDVIQIFSLKNNIRKITNTNTKEDSRLKSMQTYRVLIMNYIIYTHAFINFLSSFFLNIEALEAVSNGVPNIYIYLVFSTIFMSNCGFFKQLS